MRECPVAAVLAGGAVALAEPELGSLAEDLRSGPQPDPAAHYRRVAAVLLRADQLAAAPGGERVAGLLRGDAMVAARMRVALDVLEDVLDPDVLDPDALDPLDRAVGWQRYGRGPVTPLGAACAEDVARGLLRQWLRRGQVRRSHLAGMRVLLLGQARVSCAALRTELSREAATVNPRCGAAFLGSARRRADEAVSRLSRVLEWELAGTVGPAGPGVPVVPDPPSPAGLEHRLTALVGIGFGLGLALTIARFAGELLGGPPAVLTVLTVVWGLFGVALGGWLARSRRLLTERAALQRWVGEFTAAVRAAMEEQVALRVLLAAARNTD